MLTALHSKHALITQYAAELSIIVFAVYLKTLLTFIPSCQELFKKKKKYKNYSEKMHLQKLNILFIKVCISYQHYIVMNGGGGMIIVANVSLKGRLK